MGSPNIPDEKFLSTLSTIGTLYSPATSVEWSSEKTSDISSDDRKIILMAYDDALAFVASNGRIRGALLERAMMALRDIGVDELDMDIATMLIVSVDVASR
jgi:uncharacterized protein (TIGR02448 family)